MADDTSPADYDIEWLYREHPEFQAFSEWTKEDIEYQFVENVGKLWNDGLEIKEARVLALARTLVNISEGLIERIFKIEMLEHGPKH